MTEIPGPPESSNPAEREGSDALTRFVDATTELVHLRDDKVKAIFHDSNRDEDYQRALETYDPTEDDPNDQVTPEARAFGRVVEYLRGLESDIAARYLKTNPQNWEIYVIEPGMISQDEKRPDENTSYSTTIGVTDHQMAAVEERLNYAEDGREIVVGEPISRVLDNVEAQRYALFAQKILRYVGKGLYGRDPLPSDPA